MKGWIAIPTQKTQDNDISWPISIKATELTVLEFWECAQCNFRLPYTTKDLPDCPFCLMNGWMLDLSLIRWMRPKSRGVGL
jgi:hypothetical protein